MIFKQEQMQEIFERVLPGITPGEKERRELKIIADLLLERINSFAEEFRVRGVLVGSAARDTWISGEHDIDLFILFPETANRKTLETTGLDIARKVLFDADKIEERYAEHPYLHGMMNSYKIDLVPCFNIKDTKNIKSAVDRTPHHNNFVKKYIKTCEKDVRLAKQFLKTAGIYGSELRTHGFSGYLTELLIIQYGSFEVLLKASLRWKPCTTIDIKNHAIHKHDDPLVVIDPTDPKRNVAAALSLDNMCRFIDIARNFLKNPCIEYFSKPARKLVYQEEIEQLFHRRGTELIGITFHKPCIVEDTLYPQLEKMRNAVEKLLTRHDFRIINSNYIVLNADIYLIFELFETKLPMVKKHIGPPVWLKDNAEKFKAKYHKKSGNLSYIYIKDGKYTLNIQRVYTTPTSLFQSELLTCGPGKHITQIIKQDGFSTLSDHELFAIEHPEFRTFLYHLLTHKQDS